MKSLNTRERSVRIGCGFFLFGLIVLSTMSVGFGQAPPAMPLATPLAIHAQSTFLSYKTVRNNFGKKFADSYFVVQVDIRNENVDKQFIVQTLDVLIDPNQCLNGVYLYQGFKITECKQVFDDNFIFPNVLQPVRREELIGDAKASKDRSGHNVAFRALAFTASIGSILTGFNGLLGRDGIQGVNVLGTMFTEAAKLLFPDRTGDKLENLINAAPNEDVVIKSKESKTFNVFIPTDHVFYKDSWSKYKKTSGGAPQEAYELKVVLDLLLLSTATGVLVDNNAAKVVVNSDDQFRTQQEKFQTFDIFGAAATLRTQTFFNTIARLEADVNGSNATAATAATQKLAKILSELNKTKRFGDFLAGASLTPQSPGQEVIKALKNLSRDLTLRNRDEAVVADFESTVILYGM